MAIVIEAECLAAVHMAGGNEICLLKEATNTITTSLNPSLGRLVRGKRYRVTFEELPRPEG